MLTGCVNPTRFDYFEFVSTGHDIASEKVDKEILADIESSGVKFLVYSEPASFLGTPRPPRQRFANYDRSLFRALMRRFRPVARIGGFVILEHDRRGNAWAEDFCLGVDAWKRSDWEEAGSRMTAALASGADLADTHLLAGDAAYRMGEYESALASYSRFLERGESDGDFCFRMGNIHAALDRWDEAVAWYRKAAAASGAEPRRMLKLATALKQSGRLEEAARLAARIETEPGDTAELLLLRGSILFKCGEFREAIRLMEQYAGMSGADPAGLSLLASALLSDGRTDEAFDVHASLIEADPGNSGLKVRAAVALRMAGRFGESVTLLESAVDAAEKSTDFWLQLGLSYFEAGAHGKARKAVRRHLLGHPDDPEAQIHHARIVGSSGGIPELDPILTRAKQGEVSPGECLLLARFHLERDDPEQVERLLGKYLNSGLFTEEPVLFNDALDILGAALFRERKYRACSDTTLSLLAREPRRESALLRMAALAEKSDDRKSESVFLEKALEASPYSEKVRLARISCARRCSGKKAALEAAGEALAVLPANRTVVLAYGRAALDAGEFEKTREALAALADEPAAMKGGDSSPAAASNQGEVLLLAADLAMAQKRFGDARRFFGDYDLLAPVDARGWTGAASAALRENDPTFAVDLLSGRLDKGAPATFRVCTLLARALKAAGRDAEAAAYLYLAARKAPQDADTLSAIGDRFLGVGMPGEALRVYRMAGTKKHARAALGEADALRISGHAEKAAELYAGVTERFPGSWSAEAAAAELLLAKDDADGAADSFSRACRAAGGTDAAAIRLAGALVRCGKIHGASAALAARRSKAPDSEHVVLALAEMLNTAGKPGEAVDLLENFTGRNKSVRGLLLLAAIALESNLGETAEKAAEAAAEAGAAVTDARLASFVADRRIAEGDLRGAGSLIADLAASGKAHPSLLTWYATYLADSGRRVEAVPLLEKALKTGICDETSAMLIATYVDGAEAVNLLSRHLFEHPGKTVIRRFLGELLIESGDPGKGMSHLERAYEKARGEDASYVLALARAVRGMRGAEAALPYYREGLLLIGNDIDALLDAAGAFLDAARPHIALEILERTGEAASGDWRIISLEADALCAVGDYDRAEENLVEGLAAASKPDEVRRKLIALFASRFELERAMEAWKGMELADPDLLVSILDRYPLAAGHVVPSENPEQFPSRESLIDPEQLQAIIGSLSAAGAPGQAADLLARRGDALSSSRKSFLQAKIAAARGEPHKALIRVNFALDTESGNPEFVLFAVRTFITLGLVDNALALSGKTTRALPGNETASLARLEALLAAGNRKGGAGLADRFGWSPGGALEAAVALAGAGMFENAAKLRETAAAGEPRNSLSAAAYASSLLASGRNAEVIKLLEDSVRKEPVPLTVMLYSEAALRINCAAQALPAVSSAATRLSGSGPVLAAKAALLAGAGRYGEAADSFREAAMNPDGNLPPEIASPAWETCCRLMAGQPEATGDRPEETCGSEVPRGFVGRLRSAAEALAARKSVLEYAKNFSAALHREDALPIGIRISLERVSRLGSKTPAAENNAGALPDPVSPGTGNPHGSDDLAAGNDAAVFSAWISAAEAVEERAAGGADVSLAIPVSGERFSLVNGGDIALALGDSALALSLYEEARAASDHEKPLSRCAGWPVSAFDVPGGAVRLGVPEPGLILEAARRSFLPAADLLFAELSAATGNARTASNHLVRFTRSRTTSCFVDAATWYRTAVIHLAAGEKSRAASALDTGLEADQAASTLASALPLLVSAGRSGHAASLFDRLERLFTLTPADYAGYAASLIETGESVAAVTALERGAVAFPDSVGILLELALAYRVSNQPVLARNSLDGALSLFPGDPRPVMEIADLEYASGLPARTAFRLERIFSEIRGRSPASWNLLEEMTIPGKTKSPSRIICNYQSDFSRKQSIFFDAVAGAVKNNPAGRTKMREIRRTAAETALQEG